MAKREGLSFEFWFQNITYISLGKVTKFQEKMFCCFGVMLQSKTHKGLSPKRFKRRSSFQVWTEDLYDYSTGGQCESYEGIFKLESDNSLTLIPCDFMPAIPISNIQLS